MSPRLPVSPLSLYSAGPGLGLPPGGGSAFCPFQRKGHPSGCRLSSAAGLLKSWKGTWGKPRASQPPTGGGIARVDKQAWEFPGPPPVLEILQKVYFHRRLPSALKTRGPTVVPDPVHFWAGGRLLCSGSGLVLHPAPFFLELTELSLNWAGGEAGWRCSTVRLPVVPRWPSDRQPQTGTKGDSRPQALPVFFIWRQD